MSEQRIESETELEEIRNKIRSGEKIYVQLDDKPVHSIKSDWYNTISDARLHNKVLQVTGCHHSVKEAFRVKVLKGKHGKYLHYKDLFFLTPEQIEEMTNTVFHFNPENL